MNRRKSLFSWFKKEKKAKKEDVMDEFEVMELIEAVIVDDLEEIRDEDLDYETRKKKIEEVLKLSDKYNKLAEIAVESRKVDKIPEKGFTKVVETIKAGGSILTTGMQIATFNRAFDRVGTLEETGRWTSTAFRKLPWPKVFK